MWTIRLSKQASEFYAELAGKHRQQVDNALLVLQRDPRQGKSLRGDLKGYWSFRVGVHRIIYSIRHQEVIVDALRIHHRKEVYERLRR